MKQNQNLGLLSIKQTKLGSCSNQSEQIKNTILALSLSTQKLPHNFLCFELWEQMQIEMKIDVLSNDHIWLTTSIFFFFRVTGFHREIISCYIRKQKPQFYLWFRHIQKRERERSVIPWRNLLPFLHRWESLNKDPSLDIRASFFLSLSLLLSLLRTRRDWRIRNRKRLRRTLGNSVTRHSAIH